MPSDEMIDRLTLAGFGCLTDNNRSVTSRILAALAAAEAGEPPADYVLPCDVRLAPRTVIKKGCNLSTLLAAIKLREGWADEETRLASPPSEASRDERAVFPTIERELVACLEADGIECEQVGHAWTADVSKRTELDVTGLAVAIATAIRARGETERPREPILPLRPGEAMLMQERHEGGDYAVQVDTTTERLVQKVETPDGTTVFEMGCLSEEKS